MCNIIKYVSSDIEGITLENYSSLDSLVFAELAYSRFEERKDTSPYMNVMKLASILAKQEENKDIKELLEKMQKNEKYTFCTVIHMGATSENKKHTEQWAAIAIRLQDNTIVISYRGTDSSVVGWNEDWELAYQYGNDAQNSSKEFFNQVAAITKKGKIILTGHSKGGNNAIYAYLATKDKNIRNRVIRIDNYDGPGVLESNVIANGDMEAYLELNEKVTSYYPGDSVVGQVQKAPGRAIFIASTGVSSQFNIPIISQHDAFTWSINKDYNGKWQFEEVNQSKLSGFINRSINGILENLTEKQREMVAEFLIHANISAVLAPKDGMFSWIQFFRTYGNLTLEERSVLISAISNFLFYVEYSILPKADEYLNKKIDSFLIEMEQSINELFHPIIADLETTDNCIKMTQSAKEFMNKIGQKIRKIVFIDLIKDETL